MVEQRRTIPAPGPPQPPDPDRLPRQFTLRVVGVSFVDGYPENLGRLELAMRREELGLPAPPTPEPGVLPATLVRDPLNPKDVNAIVVHVDGIGPVGHVAASTAVRLARSIDAGTQWAAVVAEVAVSENKPNKPGITIRVTRVD